MTALDLISAALKEIGALAAGETAPSEDTDDALDRLNELVESWQAERLLVYYLPRTIVSLSSNTASYTIGSGGAINIDRPLYIVRAGLILDSAASPTTEKKIAVFSDQDWANITQKSRTSTYPQGIYYDYRWNAGLGTVYVYPVPSGGATQLVLYAAPAPVAQFANLSTDYTFPPGYARALRFNLAIELAPEFGAVVDPVLAAKAAESLGQIQRANIRPEVMSIDPVLVHPRGYDWRDDSFR